MNLLVFISLTLLMFLFVSFFVIWYWIAITNKSPYYPSSLKKIKKLIEDKEIELSPQTKFVDLGSGDGRIVNLFAKFNIARADGVEINPFLSLFSRIWSKLRGYKNVKIFNKDFYNHNLSEYDIVFMFLFEEQAEKIIDKLKKEKQKHEITVISNTFKIKSIEPYKKVDTFYFYKI